LSAGDVAVTRPPSIAALADLVLALDAEAQLWDELARNGM